MFGSPADMALWRGLQVSLLDMFTRTVVPLSRVASPGTRARLIRLVGGTEALPSSLYNLAKQCSLACTATTTTTAAAAAAACNGNASGSVVARYGDAMPSLQSSSFASSRAQSYNDVTHARHMRLIAMCAESQAQALYTMNPIPMLFSQKVQAATALSDAAARALKAMAMVAPALSSDNESASASAATTAGGVGGAGGLGDGDEDADESVSFSPKKPATLPSPASSVSSSMPYSAICTTSIARMLGSIRGLNLDHNVSKVILSNRRQAVPSFKPNMVMNHRKAHLAVLYAELCAAVSVAHAPANVRAECANILIEIGKELGLGDI